MEEKVLFKNESSKSRAEIADYLEKVVEKLRGTGEISLSSGNEDVSFQVSENAEFEVKVEEEGDEQSVEFEIEWQKGDQGGKKDIEIS